MNNEICINQIDVISTKINTHLKSCEFYIIHTLSFFQHDNNTKIL